MKTSIFKCVATAVAVSLLAEILFPLTAYALTSGPSQPEFSSFEPVATTNMVNEFSGSFTYNLPIIQIPGANGGGYALSLSYHSGASAEEEASWVGYGWTLNPGSITRNTRGFPDDYYGANVKYHNKSKKNWTISVGTVLGIEAFSLDKGGGFNIGGISGNYSLRLNNYRGYGYVAGFNSHVAGLVSYGYSVADGKGTHSWSINPARFLMNLAQGFAAHGGAAPAAAEEKSWGSEFADKMGQKLQGKAIGAYDQMFNFYAVHSYEDNQRAVNTAPYTGHSFNVTTGLQYTGIPFVGLQGQLTGNYTSQENTPLQTIPAWGYMYAGVVTTGNVNVMMDYYVEKDVPYTMRDKFLAIPFSNADNYMLAGEGLGGGFRLYNAKAGHFKKNNATSSMEIKQVGYEGSIGTSSGVGGDYGTGSQSLEVKEWTGYDQRYRFASEPLISCEEEIDEPYFFRFNNDLGGKVTYENGVHDAEDTPRRGVGVAHEINPVVNAGQRSGRSSYIAYHTNADIPSDGYTKDPSVNSHISRTKGQTTKGVGEIAVYNEQGNRYVYGLPVYSMKEQTLQYGNKVHNGDPELRTDNERYRAYYPPGSGVDGPNSATYVVGEERDQPYATSYLLTEITTPDYIDLSDNGPTSDDLGGYVRFAYERAYGSTTKHSLFHTSLYKWRIPYAGMLYQRNELSEPDDNTGSVMNGYKEIYYLDTIETKTHYAVFIKSDRLDGLGAAAEASALTDTSAKGTQALKKLDRIRLYAKGADGVPGSDDKLLHTVCFEYENSLCRKLPNSNGSVYEETGKLTLKKVWFEYEGVVQTRITPYVFGYEYRGSAYYTGRLSSELMTRYGDIVNYGDNWSAAQQNPDYDPCNIDAWGSYQENGRSRYHRMQQWVNQNPSPGFDPAAWQLKWIHLPTGGEIHIQYEQNDYSYVQDRRALAMVKTHASGNTPDGDKFYLDVTTSLGGSVTPQQVADLIQTQFVNTQEEMYFKILYSLYDPGAVPTFTNAEIIGGSKRGAEYITGYSRVKETGVENGKAYVVFENKPRQVGLDLVEAQKAGREERPDFSNVGPLSVLGTVVDFISNFGRTFFDEATSCMNANWDESYIRVPVPQPKKGGGVRVKRLLMVDPGLDGAGSGAIYGNEYDYTMIDEDTGERISSGVAANEPGAMREENALVTSLKKRFDQTGYQRATAGKDKEQFEGPIGESVLPGASVGYARVIVKNIHDGVTGNGFTVHEYFTARDYPFDKHYPHLGGDGVAWTDLGLIKSRSQTSLILSNKTYEDIRAEQGYRFIVNSMHGQSKRVATYGGTYDDESSWLLSSMQEYTYFEPGEMVPMFNGPEKPFRYDTPGKEMEVVFEGRHIVDKTNNFSLEVDVSFVAGLPFPLPTAFPTWNKSESILRTHVTTKVVRYPAIQKSVLSYKDGIYHLAENVAFHPATGKPLLTRTTDGYDKLSLFGQPAHNGTYHAYNFAAEQDYAEMGRKSANERAWVYSSTATHTIAKSGLQLSFTGVSEYIQHTLTKRLYPGDLIELTYAGGAGKRTFYVGGINVGSGTVTLEDAYPVLSAIDGNVSTIEVIRSGRSNDLVSMAGNVSTYGENKQLSYDYLKELAKRQKLANMLNNALLRGRSERLYVWNTFGLKFRMSSIHPDSSSNLIRALDPEHAIGMEVSCDEIVFSPKRVVCNDSTNPHPLVVQLNATLDQLWATTITTATTSTTVCAGLNVTDYRYSSTDANIMWMQDNVIQPHVASLISAASTCTPWPWGAEFANMSISMQPATPAGYYSRDKVTGLQSGAGPKQLTSLEIKYGSRHLLRCYVTTGTTCQYTWGFLPDMEENLPQGVTYADFSGTGQSFATLTGTFTTSIGKFGQTNLGILFFDCLLTGKRHYFNLRFDKNVLDPSVPPTGAGLVTTIQRSPTGPGHFAVSDDGQIVYYRSGSSTPVSIACLDLPIGTAGVVARKDAGPDVTRVVSATAQTYDDNWTFDPVEYGVPSGMGLYQSGRRGKWRPKDSYVYKTDISNAVAGGTADRVYNAGIYSTFALFNKANPAQEWLKLTTVTRYSPYGEALEEKDILDIPKTAKFGYSNTVPVLIAHNAENTAVAFTSFEDQATGGGVVDNYAHSGNKSYLLGSAATYATGSLTLNAKLKEQGLQVKFWVRTSNFAPLDGNFLVQLNRGGSITTFPSLTKIARTGEWTLYEAVYPAASLAALSDGSFTVQLRGGNADVHIDDIRVQPLDAQMTTYVYDASTLRVTAIMDDQHFGLYYQYNAEGKLVRKLKESERGIKTVAETQYHTPMVERNEDFAMLSAPTSPSRFPSLFENVPSDQNGTFLEQILEGSDNGAGSSFDYEKRIGIPERHLDVIRQQTDSINGAVRKALPKRQQAPRNNSDTGNTSSNSNK